MTADIPRLTDDELDDLLAEHTEERHCGSTDCNWKPLCKKCLSYWPCTSLELRLATEVKERRDEAKAYAMMARYEEGGR